MYIIIASLYIKSPSCISNTSSIILQEDDEDKKEDVKEEYKEDSEEGSEY